MSLEFTMNPPQLFSTACCVSGGDEQIAVFHPCLFLSCNLETLPPEISRRNLAPCIWDSHRGLFYG